MNLDSPENKEKTSPEPAALEAELNASLQAGRKIKRKKALYKALERAKNHNRKAKALTRAIKIQKQQGGFIDPEVLKEIELVSTILDAPTIAWEPHPKQTEFLESDEDEVLFTGGRGSAKSSALIIDPLPNCGNKNFRALLIRKSMPDLRDLISRARELYPKAYPGVKWKEQEKMFIFPSGAKIEFGYCDSLDDVERYHGQEYYWIGIDELAQYPQREYYTKLRASLRGPDQTLKKQMRATSNPGGPGQAWIKDMFVDQAPAGRTFVKEFHDHMTGTAIRITKKWIHSTIYDNPTLLKHNPQYLAQLMDLPEANRKQWLENNWNTVEGAAFPEFSSLTHVIEPIRLPPSWRRFRAIDWGYSERSLAVCLWFCVDPSYNIYIYRELSVNKMDADVFARRCMELEKDDRVSYGVIDGSVADQRGGGTSIDQMMRAEGFQNRYADKSKDSRKSGKMLVHQYLSKDTKGQPRLKIFDTCRQIIKELGSLAIDNNNPEDVDTDSEDHAYDALRYGLSTRPPLGYFFNILPTFKPSRPPVAVNSTIGY